MYPYKYCRSPQRTVAAALSAAVTRTKLIGEYTHLTGGTKPEETYRPKRQLLFGREREGGASLREAASLAYLPQKSREIVQGFCADCSCFLG